MAAFRGRNRVGRLGLADSVVAGLDGDTVVGALLFCASCSVSLIPGFSPETSWIDGGGRMSLNVGMALPAIDVSGTLLFRGGGGG